MDTEIAPLIAPLVVGDELVLSTKEQHALAVWATKIGLVYESLDGPLVPAEVYKWFFDNREPLDGQPIQLARYVDAEDHTYIRKVFAVKNGSTFEVDYYESVVLGVIIGQYLAITVFPIQEIFAKRLPEGSDRVSIWPARAEDVLWPPVEHFELNTLDRVVQYANRP